MLDQDTKDELARKLYDIGIVRFGEFTLKSGLTSPIYLDHRLLATHPKTLKYVARIYAQLLEDIEYDRLVGIPYAALPITGAVSLLLEKAWIYPRKEIKEHGTKAPIEGRYHSGELVVVLDDVITKGGSKIEALRPLEAEGLIVRDIVVLFDYQKGGAEMLKQRKYRLHAAMSMRELIDSLYRQDLIDPPVHSQAIAFLEEPGQAMKPLSEQNGDRPGLELWSGDRGSSGLDREQ